MLCEDKASIKEGENAAFFIVKFLKDDDNRVPFICYKNLFQKIFMKTEYSPKEVIMFFKSYEIYYKKPRSENHIYEDPQKIIMTGLLNHAHRLEGGKMQKY